MRILLTNDDGIHAPGFEVLEDIARELSDEIWVCAPAEEQSGAGHSLTLHHPVRLRQLGERRYSVTGTPTDSVMLALRTVLEDKQPDLILSGVNRGANLGDDITYSGTASAAMEGALGGIKSIALSQVYKRDAEHELFDAARTYGADVIRKLIDAPFGDRTLININFPPLPADKVRGIRAVRQGFHDYSRGSVVKGRDPRGLEYYWFGLYAIEHTLDHGTDLEAIDEGFVSVTPLQLDLTQHSLLSVIGERFE
ncbi:5'/3'-nucleotidase SurE [Erythrobacter litoralis]|uniref:5'-nucleotidase SurE n=1 Tax=Erythrobacter litoralis (strain HTCC2594) TaxID=314225 RepID=SURE_ERYLH|nr:5'/3'-nucleotidase SurE [Erythrobacter litoralis]Q2NDM8.1 RecName: Full=5'-nucleotidase SurE; AltName: Full=Nucleoside 5'-monophosphate phosphohydrolase [Erythrobacter litoralis HTCC2594]ABC62213.1 stationary-phase survival protein [Erythrobacter litoralis HTCC2594]